MATTDALARSQVLDLFTLAIADGFVSPEELALIYEKGKQLGLGSTEIDEIIHNPHRVAFAPPASLVDAVARLYDLAQVLITDGRVDPREVDTIRAFAERFEIRPDLIGGIIEALIEEVRAGTPREQLVSTLSREISQ